MVAFKPEAFQGKYAIETVDGLCEGCLLFRVLARVSQPQYCPLGMGLLFIRSVEQCPAQARRDGPSNSGTSGILARM